MRMKKWTLCCLILTAFSCEDRLDTPVMPDTDRQTTVSLSIDFAPQTDGTDLNPATKTPTITAPDRHAAALNAFPVPATHTRGAAFFPDKLYALDLYQYDSSGAFLTYTSLGTKNPGESFTASLHDNGGNECQLLIIARGETAALASFAGKSLSDVRKLTADASVLETIGASDGSGINNMPYLLYLPRVKISGGKLVSPEGSDIRLRLRRLAVGLTLDWHFDGSMTAAGYSLTEVRLMQIPKNCYILPERENSDLYGQMYPTSVSGFTDGFRLTGSNLASAGGTMTLWVPANARGIRSEVTNPLYRTKTYAHPAATYAEFVVNNDVKEERLLYRVYLGANATSDFNLLENTDYHWTIQINQADYAHDPRIQYQRLSPVVSTNQVPTSNCLMLPPGGNICFNPYAHEAGADGWNTSLAPGGVVQTDQIIDHVRVLWQTKDAGTSGDLVLGYVKDDTHHENLANITDAGDVQKARIHVDAPLSEGGNAVVAAYNQADEVVWSWHLWITDYVPAPLAGSITSVNRLQAVAAAQQASQNGTVQVYGGVSWTDAAGAFYDKVIMDRNLGATRAGLQSNLLDAVRTFGLLYQGGRKDPFFCSADGTANETKTIYDGFGKEVAIEKKKPAQLGYTVHSYAMSVRHPLVFFLFNDSEEFLSFNDVTNPWGSLSGKTIYDPCPKGWRVPANEYASDGTKNARLSMMAGFGSASNDWIPENVYPTSTNNLQYYDGETIRPFGSGKIAQSDRVGSGFVYTGGSGEGMTVDQLTNKSAFFPGVSLREKTTGIYRTVEGGVPIKNNVLYLWSSSYDTRNALYIYQFQSSKLYFQHSISRGYGFSVRCVQDRSAG